MPKFGFKFSEESKKKMSNSHKGQISHWKDKKFTEEHKLKLSIAHLGQKSWNKGTHIQTNNSLEVWQKNGGQVWNKGKKIMVKPNSGTFKKGHIPWHKGKKFSIELRDKLSKSHKGKYMGKDSHLWKGGTTPLIQAIRNSEEYNNWRKEVYRRDNYTCQECFRVDKNIDAHHKDKSLKQLIQEFLQYYSQFSLLEDRETLIRLAVTYVPFWDLLNGITYCRKCHRKTENYARRVL